MTEEKNNTIGDLEIKNEDLTPEQQHYKNHVISLRNKMAKLQFEIDDLAPALKFHENALLETTKKQAEEVLGKKEDQSSVEES